MPSGRSSEMLHSSKHPSRTQHAACTIHSQYVKSCPKMYITLAFAMQPAGVLRKSSVLVRRRSHHSSSIP
jgi:hypothetical protein